MSSSSIPPWNAGHDGVRDARDWSAPGALTPVSSGSTASWRTCGKRARHQPAQRGRVVDDRAQERRVGRDVDGRDTVECPREAFHRERAARAPALFSLGRVVHAARLRRAGSGSRGSRPARPASPRGTPSASSAPSLSATIVSRRPVARWYMRDLTAQLAHEVGQRAVRVVGRIRQRRTARRAPVRESPLRQVDVHVLAGAAVPLGVEPGDDHERCSARRRRRRPLRRCFAGDTRCSAGVFDEREAGGGPAHDEDHHTGDPDGRDRKRARGPPADGAPRRPRAATARRSRPREHGDGNARPHRARRHEAAEHGECDERDEHPTERCAAESVRRHHEPVTAPPCTRSASMRTTGIATKNSHDNETTASANISAAHGASSSPTIDGEQARCAGCVERPAAPVGRHAATPRAGTARSAGCGTRRTRAVRTRARSSSRGTRRSSADRGTRRRAAAP